MHQKAWKLLVKEQHIVYMSLCIIVTELLDKLGHFEGTYLAAFLVGCFTLCYLAKFTGDVMENLCEYIPSRVAALISAFLGNVPELIANAVALSKGMSYFILIALLGGAVSNGLFLMGSCIGMSEYGFPKKPLEEKPAHVVNIAVIGITCSLCCLPTIVQAGVLGNDSKASWLEQPTKATIGVNYAVCVILLLLYIFITYYQLVYDGGAGDKDEKERSVPMISPSQGDVRKIFDESSQGVTNDYNAIESGEVARTLKPVDPRRRSDSGGSTLTHDEAPSTPRSSRQVSPQVIGTSGYKSLENSNKSVDEAAVEGKNVTGEEAVEDADDEPLDSMNVLLLKLCFAVVGIALASDVVTGSMDEMNSSGTVPTEFMLFAIVGIVGNVPEHYSSLYMSWKKGDLSMGYGTAFGSSGQLLGLILPFLSIIQSSLVILYHPKYLVMLQISWIIPLLIVVFDLHSIPMAIFMLLVYVACAAVAYVDF